MLRTNQKYPAKWQGDIGVDHYLRVLPELGADYSFSFHIILLKKKWKQKTKNW